MLPPLPVLYRETPMSTSHVKARPRQPPPPPTSPPRPPFPSARDVDESTDDHDLGIIIDDDDDDDDDDVADGDRDDPLANLDVAELKRLGIFFVSESARQKSASHARRVEATIARRNHEARVFKEEEEKRLLQATKDEHERLRRISERINARSALHVDQWQADVTRKNRLALVNHLRQTRKKRAAIVAGPKKPEPKAIPPMPDVVYVGINPVDYEVRPNKVLMKMAMNEKATREQLQSAKQHKAKLATLIRRELEDTKKMFPGLLSGTVPAATGPSGPTSSSAVAKRKVLAPRPLSGVGNTNTNTNTNSSNNNQKEPGVPGTRARPATAGGGHAPRPVALDTLLDPLRLAPSSFKENDEPLLRLAAAGYTFSNAAAPVTVLTSPSSPGGKGGLTVRRPHSSPLVRQQRPTSPILRFVKDVERDGRLSTRYDSPAVALHAAQPELPPRLGVPDIRPDVAVRYDLFGAQVPEI